MSKSANNTEHKKHRQRPKANNIKAPSATISPANLARTYRFLILFGVLILAGIAMVLKIDLPVVWTFLYGIGGWAALTTNPRNNLR